MFTNDGRSSRTPTWTRKTELSHWIQFHERYEWSINVATLDVLDDGSKRETSNLHAVALGPLCLGRGEVKEQRYSSCQ